MNRERNNGLSGPEVRAAGRIMLHRDKGKLQFIDIEDWTGRIQLLLDHGSESRENLQQAKSIYESLRSREQLTSTDAARAQAVTLNQYRAAETPEDGFAISRPDDLGHLRFAAQLHLDYALVSCGYRYQLQTQLAQLEQ